jgi:hypothetical protein
MRNAILLLVSLAFVLVACKAKEGAKCRINSDCADGNYCTSPDEGTVESTCMSRVSAEAACATGPTCTKWKKCKFSASTGNCMP